MTSIVDGVLAEPPPPTSADDDQGESDFIGLSPARSSELARRLLTGGMAIVVLAVWLPSLTWGFITDEHITAWVTQDGFGDAIARAQEHQGNSPAYFALIWVVRQFIGASSIALRLPSVLALFGAAYHLTRFGAELDRRDVGLIAAFLLLANDQVLIRGTSARPYGILLLLLIVSIRFLFRYLHTHRVRHGLVWIIAGVASLHMTPFAALMLAPHLVLLWNARKRNTLPAENWAGFAALALFIALPLAPQIIDLASRSDSLVISEQPSIEGLAQFIVPSIGVIAVLAGFMIGGRGERFERSAVGWRTVVTWAVVPIVLLYLMGVAGSPVVGVSRYRLGALPGAGLALGMVMVRLRRPIGYLAAVGTLVALSLLQLSSYTEAREGWREATQWTMEEIAGTDAIMAYDFGLIEQKNVAQVADPHFAGYFTAPALVYGVEHPVRPLPIGEGPDVTAYLDTLLVELTQYDTIAMITKVRRQPDYDEFAERLLDLGYEEIEGPPFGFLEANVYVRD